MQDRTDPHKHTSPAESTISTSSDSYSFEEDPLHAESKRAREDLMSLPLGALSQEFSANPHARQCPEDDPDKIFNLRLKLEIYIASGFSPENLANVETAIQATGTHDREIGMIRGKAEGTYIMEVPPKLICQVYQLENVPLVDLFKKYFPTPPSQLFEEGRVPELIQKNESAILETVKNIDVKTLEPFVIQKQRHVRMKKRHREEVNRITSRYKEILEFRQISAEELIQDANTPYQPKCPPKLSARIMTAAKKVAAVSTVKHITIPGAIKSIFDEALYGRRTLVDFYLPFEEAALIECDIKNGDVNAGCLGLQDIDPRANGSIIIEFDLSKLIQNKPCAFYKQRDLGYSLDRIRNVRLGNGSISFNHTAYVDDPRISDVRLAWLKTFASSQGKSLLLLARVLKSSLIAYNLEKMHEILTLNFFRFLDAVEKLPLKGKPCRAYIDHIYRKIGKLSDEELVAFLTDIEKNMTDTAEFNFYGAHQIDFSTIINISHREKKYTLNLPMFLDHLNQGNMNELHKAKLYIPELFFSYRFLDYLLQNIQHPEVRYCLDDLRSQCKTPQWVQYTPLSASDKVTFFRKNESPREFNTTTAESTISNETPYYPQW